MRILTIESNNTGDVDPEERENWPVELRDAYALADVVIYLFAPFAHTILKGPEDLTVTDVRSSFAADKWEFYQAQWDIDAAQEEAKRVRVHRRR